MNKPEISVIVPVYKTEKYLRRCIDSILEQTFNDFEIILVDDGSPDGCPAICDEYTKKDDRIRVIHKENGGLSSARNEGMKVAEGKYIMFCDSDDKVDSKWCETFLVEANNNPDAWIVSDVWKIKQDGKHEKFNNEIDHISKSNYFEIYKMGLSAYVWNKIYRKDKIQELNLVFDESCYFAEDVEFNVKYCMGCDSVIFIPKPLYFYYDTPGSIMKKFYPNWLELHLPLFYKRLPLISDKNIGEYCDIWLYHFINMFDSVFDKRNTMGFIQKMKYNYKMMNTEEMRFCIEHASGEKESAIVMKVLKKHNYYLFWIFQKIVKLKRRIRG